MRCLLVLLAVGAACKTAPAPPGPVETLTLGGVRCLAQYVGGARPGDRVPVVFSLHAMGGNLEYSIELFTPLKVPARVVAPCGRERGGACDWYNLGDANGPSDSAERVLQVFAALQQREPVGGRPIVMGFSQGAVVAFALAQEHPQQIAAAFPVAGTLPSTGLRMASADLPPVQVFLGAKDPVFKLADVQASVEALKRQGYRAELKTYPGLEHELGDEEIRDVRAGVERALRDLR